MKFFIALICTIVAVVFSENCTNDDTTSCGVVICQEGTVPVCDTNICTCDDKPEPGQCHAVGDCEGYWQNHHCSLNHRQCLAGFCQCVHGHG